MSERSDKDALSELEARFAAFTNACAHDLRAPARNIGSLGELLMESGATERMSGQDAALLQGVISESQRMTAILDGVVEYARVPLRAERAVVDVGRLVRAHWLASDCCLTIDALPQVVGDTKLLASLISKLLSNVVRFAGDEPPRLHVFAEREAGVVELHFADQGIGIPEGREQLVFSVLRRCHSEGGVGAGLTVCARIAAAHCGSIRVVHGRKDGATIVVSLPDDEGGT